MKILNLFLIILILYLIYKIVTNNEGFETINLSGADIINSRNIFMNIDESRIEEINKIPELDLSKNNLIIDNRYSNKVSITDKLCVGNYCINNKKIKLLTGEIDGPQFYKTNLSNKISEPVYYNHDCDIGVDNSNSFECKIDKNIDYPNKLCFNSLDEDGKKNDPTCIGPNEFDVLKGIRGIKLKHINSQPDTNDDNAAPNQYMTPYYIDFKQSGYNLEGTKDQLFFKNNNECLTKDLLYKENRPNIDDLSYKDLIDTARDDYDLEHLFPKKQNLKLLTGQNRITKTAEIKAKINDVWWKNNGGKKFPYVFDPDLEVNCDESSCNDPIQKYMCPHTCKIPIKNDEIKDSSNTHGSYEPDIDAEDEDYVEKNYTGYFLSKSNNNTKYNLKENAVSRVSTFLGDSLNTHRISGESDDCFSVDVPANKKYYCDGKNSSTTAKKEQICDLVSHKKENIRKCINDKVADVHDDDETDPTVYPDFNLAKAAQGVYYNECVEEHSGVSEDNSGQDVVIDETDENTDITLNYIMTPAKDVNGNNINANTYFHGHSHIH